MGQTTSSNHLTILLKPHCNNIYIRKRISSFKRIVLLLQLNVWLIYLWNNYFQKLGNDFPDRIFSVWYRISFNTFVSTKSYPGSKLLISWSQSRYFMVVFLYRNRANEKNGKNVPAAIIRALARRIQINSVRSWMPWNRSRNKSFLFYILIKYFDSNPALMKRLEGR